eukprot:1195077-Prorocentrum_minimum.AAC.6
MGVYMRRPSAARAATAPHPRHCQRTLHPALQALPAHHAPPPSPPTTGTPCLHPPLQALPAHRAPPPSPERTTPLAATAIVPIEHTTFVCLDPFRIGPKLRLAISTESERRLVVVTESERRLADAVALRWSSSGALTRPPSGAASGTQVSSLSPCLWVCPPCTSS